MIEEIVKRIKTEAQPQAVSKSEETHSASTQAHEFVPYEKKCIGCGEADNPNYREPNVYCSTCGNPMGSISGDFEGETDDIKPCRNCGGKHGVKWEGWHRSDED